MTTLSTNLNISQLTDELWTGGDLPDALTRAAARLEGWRQHGIRHIIDNRLECSDEGLVKVLAPEICYLHNGVDDAGQQMPDSWFQSVADFADESALLGGGLLVHCHMGINRGPTGAYAVLLTRGWDPVAAIELIRTARPIAAVGYAEDALRWWHRTNNTPTRQRRTEVAGLADWRRRNPHDTVRIIRDIRKAQER